MANLDQTLELCIQKGNNVLTKMRESCFAPDSIKSLEKKWSLKEASELIGVSTEAIRKAENAGKIPKSGINPKNKRREFTLEQINICREHFKTRPSKGEDGEACITAFINFKGGVYKSTSSIHFAQHMALQGFKVLFVDADSQATSTHLFGFTPDDETLNLKTIGEILTNECDDISDLIIETSWDGLDLIPANLSLYDAELIVPMMAAKKEFEGNFYLNLRNALDEVKDAYDVIVIDAPPSLGIVNMNVVYASDGLIIPTPPLFADFTSTLQFFVMLKDIVEKITDDRVYKFIKLLITKFDGSEESKAFVKVIRHVFGQDLVVSNIFSNTKEIPRATQNIKTIYEVTDISVKRTYDRALSIVERVNSEIEDIIKSTWPAYSDELLIEGVI